MTLRNRLLALSLLTLLLPWSGWKLLQELETFLRESQEAATLSAARTLAGTLPFESLSQLLYSPQRYAMLRELEYVPVLDGFADDWPDKQHGLEMQSEDGSLQLRLLAGQVNGGLYLLFEISDLDILPGGLYQGRDGMELLLRSPRGLLRFQIEPEAPGPVQLHSDGGGGQAEGYWRDTRQGYAIELLIPASSRNTDLAFTLGNKNGQSGAQALISTQAPGGQQQWISLLPGWSELSVMLASSAPAGSRVWLVNRDGWVLADSGPTSQTSPQQTTWAQRLFYRLIAGDLSTVIAQREERTRLQSEVLSNALAGNQGGHWSQDPETAVVRNTVAVPVQVEDKTRGAIVMQSDSDGLLLVANRALGRLLIITLVITFGLAGGLWVFATRLSQRVRRLSVAVSGAMEDASKEGLVTEVLPLTADRDELGELARNNEKLLRAVSDYTQYLQTLAGKLSHELKTPLAITRSSLDNLSSKPLDAEGQQFLQRAQEGVERQTAIVRAMSEASRLEAVIRVADRESLDLAALVNNCADAYRSVYPGRRIELAVSEEPLMLNCAPDLLAQALDKLVDNAISMSSMDDSVRIGLARQGEELILSVRNSGSRLPNEYQERLFDSLVSLREKRGTHPHLGLGLYIVRLVANAHDGRVSAHNLEDGQGVEFSVCLPVKV